MAQFTRGTEATQSEGSLELASLDTVKTVKAFRVLGASSKD